MDEWKRIDEFPRYSVSIAGQVRNDKTGKMLTPFKTNAGHIAVGLSGIDGQHNRMVSRLVAEAFLPPPVNDKFDTPIYFDGDLSNCRVSNLTWRPRWFAIKHTRQFRVSEPYPSKPLRCIGTGEEFASVWDAVKKYGLLYNDIVLSILNRTYVFPTMQTFDWAE